MNPIDIAKPQLVAGTMNWGEWGKHLSTQQMNKLIKDLIDSGITFFDHADIYGGYTTEAEFGKAIEHSGLKREEYLICTKLGIQLLHQERGNTVKHYQYDYPYIIKSVETSVELLKCSYIDALLLHRPSPLIDEREIATAVNQLHEDNLIKSFGVSNWNASQLEVINKHTNISFNQIELSLTASQALVNGTLDKMKQLDIKLMAWSPLGDFYQRQADNKLVISVHQLAKKYGVASSAILINWLLQLPLAVYPVFGSTNINRIAAMQQAYSFDLSIQEWFYLWQVARGKEVD